MPLRRALLAGLAAAAIVVAVVLVVRHSHALPSGPQAIAWDRETCSECHMLIRDARFAAQLQTADGAVRSFDDPGCMMVYLQHQRPKIHALWFRDSQSDQWLREEEAGFLRSAQTPMGHGWAVVRKGTPGARSMSEALKGVS